MKKLTVIAILLLFPLLALGCTPSATQSDIAGLQSQMRDITTTLSSLQSEVAAHSTLISQMQQQNQSLYAQIQETLKTTVAQQATPNYASETRVVYPVTTPSYIPETRVIYYGIPYYIPYYPPQPYYPPYPNFKPKPIPPKPIPQPLPPRPKPWPTPPMPRFTPMSPKLGPQSYESPNMSIVPWNREKPAYEESFGKLDIPYDREKPAAIELPNPTDSRWVPRIGDTANIVTNIHN